MNRTTKLALAITSVLAFSGTQAFAFNNSFTFGGMAKYHAHSAANAYGKTHLNALTKGKGSVSSVTVSEQFNKTYKEVKPGRFTVGGTSGSINTMNMKWNNILGHVGVQGSSSASGSSSIGGMKGGIRRGFRTRF